MTNVRTIQANGVNLCIDTRGVAGDPAILLMSGAAGSMDWWEEEFCDRLVAGRRFVIRYDHRDTGQSVTYPPGEPPYTIDDLASDAVAILDVLGIDTAHLVGVSMGGVLAQRIAVHHPERVASLVLISTTPGSPGDGDADLPPLDDDLFADDAAAANPDWSDRAAVVNHYVASQRALGPPGHFDEAGLAKLTGQVFDRTRDMAAGANHFMLAGGEPVRDLLGQITVPTLVVHGTADPLFRLGHAEALVREIPGAHLMPLEGGGHQMPPQTAWPQLIPALLRHTSGGWGQQADLLASAAVAAGDPTGWFEDLYGAAVSGEVAMPWDRSEPHPLLVRWVESVRPDGAGRRAVVVGCGLGADAEYISSLGFATVGFDLSATAIGVARERHRSSGVEYVVADLLDLPPVWAQAFDLVVEIYTVQAVPHSIRPQMIQGVASLVAPGGSLIAVEFRSEPGRPDGDGPPWPLNEAEIDSFAIDGLARTTVEQVPHPEQPDVTFWVTELSRPPDQRANTTDLRRSVSTAPHNGSGTAGG